MSMISEQVKQLKEEAEWLENDQEKRLGSILRQAADTIEALSAKLAANSGWIPCSERLPEKNGFVYPHVIAFAYEDNGWNMYIAVYDFYEDKKWRQAHGDMEEIYDVSYWMHLPKEPQHGQMD